MFFATCFRDTGLPFLLILSVGVALAEGTEPAVRVVGLRCEYCNQPLGIDTLVPRLSWQLESSLRGQKQAAYRVLVARTRAALQAECGDLWDSGKVASHQNVNISYVGKTLLSGQHASGRLWPGARQALRRIGATLRGGKWGCWSPTHGKGPG